MTSAFPDRIIRMLKLHPTAASPWRGFGLIVQNMILECCAMGVVAAVRPLKLLSLVFLLSGLSLAQSSPRVLITKPVDESQLTVLKGNTHPLARAEFDQGAAPMDLPMNRMLLVLKRSDEQE
ncbi:MAG: hypothetical protein ACHP8A_12375, partial [Terriglobales bacterium]